MEEGWNQKVVPVVGDSWVQARPFAPSQKPELVTWHVVRTITHLDRTAVSAGSPRTRNVSLTSDTTCHHGGISTTNRHFQFSLQHQCAGWIASASMSGSSSTMSVDQKAADSYAARRLVLQTWRTALRPTPTSFASCSCCASKLAKVIWHQTISINDLDLDFPHRAGAEWQESFSRKVKMQIIWKREEI